MSATMSTAHDGHVVIDLPAQVIHVSRDDLEAIVQAAYDEHGILATPSFEREAERAAVAVAELAQELSDSIRSAVAASHEQQAINAGTQVPA